MKTLKQIIAEAKQFDIELKPHGGKGTHYKVHKIHNKEIEPDQLKVGEVVSDTGADDLSDMGYNVKFHKS
jgi:hypothetical protein